jgi:hypothetical protein
MIHGEGGQAHRDDLDRSAAFIGDAWVRSWRDQLARERRRVIGGWPGTMSEARTRVRAYFERERANGPRAQLSGGDLETVARAAYGRARACWLSIAGDDDDPIGDADGAFEGGRT